VILVQKSILVPLDGSAFAEEALPTALAIAARESARLELVIVHEVLPPYRVHGAPPRDSRFDNDIREERSSYVNGIADWARRTTPVPVTATIVDGPVVITLAEHIGTRVDMVVMTSHGRGGLSRLWLGSVADGLVRRVTVPVLVIRPDGSEGRAQPPRSFARILVPLDGSPFAEDAIEQAVALGGPDTEYMLLEVVPLLVTEVLVARVADVVHVEAEADRVQTEEYLGRTADRLRSRGLQVTTRTLVHHQPARAILEYAADQGVDLIAIATHGRGVAGRLLFGSVADKVLRGAAIPVLIHRPTAPVGTAATP
jgi:nucleotide-binding universal stress UspA family protein